MQAPGPSRSLRRSPGAEPGPPPNVPARSISPAVGLAGSVQPRSSTASARSNHSNERSSTNPRRPGVGFICSVTTLFALYSLGRPMYLLYRSLTWLMQPSDKSITSSKHKHSNHNLVMSIPKPFSPSHHPPLPLNLALSLLPLCSILPPSHSHSSLQF